MPRGHNRLGLHVGRAIVDERFTGPDKTACFSMPTGPHVCLSLMPYRATALADQLYGVRRGRPHCAAAPDG
jgi:hypothetical protein